MTQLSVKFSPRRIIIVCLIILAFGTAIVVQNASRAEPVRNYINAYVSPVFTAAAGIVTFKSLSDMIHNYLKHPKP